jgi:4-hydroxy-3-methylbut-2-enyl diphosphate reductase IspH
MYLKLITPSGFCMGVERAISMLDDLVNNNPDKKIYCLHEIVHNPNVVDYFKNK